MSAVPYTFANNYGNIPLSQLDVNFANCKAKADLAGYVTANAQSNITSIGTLTSLSVTGNVKCGNVNTGGNVTTSKWLLATTGVSTVGNILGNTISASGNITSPSGIFTNLTTSGNLNITGNFVVAGTLISSAISSTSANITGSLIGGNILTNGNILGDGAISTTGNITAGTSVNANLSVVSAGFMSAAGDVVGSSIIAPKILTVPEYANITATATYSLSANNSINILIANNVGYTATLNMPASARDGQICDFSISGNALTLAVGTGTVLPTFAGATAVGTGYRYVYRLGDTSWYRIG